MCCRKQDQRTRLSSRPRQFVRPICNHLLPNPSHFFFFTFDMGKILYTPTKCAQVYHMKMMGSPDANIMQKFGSSRATIYNVIKNFKKNGDFYVLKSCAGPPVKMTAQEDRLASRAITTGEAKTAVDVQQQLVQHVTPQTAHQHL